MRALHTFGNNIGSIKGIDSPRSNQQKLLPKCGFHLDLLQQHADTRMVPGYKSLMILPAKRHFQASLMGTIGIIRRLTRSNMVCGPRFQDRDVTKRRKKQTAARGSKTSSAGISCRRSRVRARYKQRTFGNPRELDRF